MQRFILAIGLIGAALVLQGCGGKTAAAVKATTTMDCLAAISTTCDAVVAEASAADVKRLADDGKKVCDGYGNGTIFANPVKYSACEVKLAQYQVAIGGTSWTTDANGLTTAQLMGAWQRKCNSVVIDQIAPLWKGGCPNGINATTISAAVVDYLLYTSSILQHDIMKQRVTDKLAELATYTQQYTAAARLYDATVQTPTHTSAPFVMIGVGAATVMVVGSAALGLKKFLQNRQTSHSSSAMQSDEDEEEAAGNE